MLLGVALQAAAAAAALGAGDPSGRWTSGADAFGVAAGIGHSYEVGH